MCLVLAWCSGLFASSIADKPSVNKCNFSLFPVLITLIKAVASLSSLPSPPFAPPPSSQGRCWLYAPLKTRHHDATYHNTTINDSTTTVYGQPVNQSTADNQFTTDAPQAIALQTTTLQLHSKGTAGAPQTYRRRTADADAPQMHRRCTADADNNNNNNNHNIPHRRQLVYHRQPQPQP